MDSLNAMLVVPTMLLVVLKLLYDYAIFFEARNQLDDDDERMRLMQARLRFLTRKIPSQRVIGVVARAGRT